jgi:hypothetical protein
LAGRPDFRYILARGIGSSAASSAPGKTAEKRVSRTIHPVAGCVALALIAVDMSGATAAAGTDFPLIGTYTQNVACKGDGSDPDSAKVTISSHAIVSNVSDCTILETKKDGDSYFARVECKFPSGPLMGDITFTPRPDNTVEFVDRDMTYKAILYRCPH